MNIVNLNISDQADKNEILNVIGAMTPSEIVNGSLLITESRNYGKGAYFCWLYAVKFRNYTISVTADPVPTRKISQKNVKLILMETISYGMATLINNSTEESRKI